MTMLGFHENLKPATAYRRKASALTAALLWGAASLSPRPATAAPDGELAADPLETKTSDVKPDEVEVGERAHQLRVVAGDLYFDEDYEGALEAFTAAMELSPHSTDLFNIGRIHEEMGQLSAALERYEQFVAQPRIPLDERAAAAERIEVLRKLVQKEEEGASKTPSLALQPVGTDPAIDQKYDNERQAHTRLFTAGVSVAAVGAALAIGGGVGFGIVARRNNDEIEDLSAGENPGRLTLSEAEDLEAQGRDYETLQIAALATGGAMVAAGVTMALVGQRRRARADRERAALQSVAPVFSSQGLTLQARWSF